MYEDTDIVNNSYLQEQFLQYINCIPHISDL